MDALRFSLVVVFAFNAALTIYSNLVQKKKIEKLEKHVNELSKQNKRIIQQNDELISILLKK